MDDIIEESVVNESEDTTTENLENETADAETEIEESVVAETSSSDDEILATLNSIQYTLNSVADSVNASNMDIVYDTTYSDFNASSGGINAYYVECNNMVVYLPYDKVGYLAVTADDEIINVSSSTITCYALNDSGDVVGNYRLPAYQSMQYYQYQYTANGRDYYEWVDVNAYGSNSNIVFGQVGINSIESILLFLTLFGVGLILFTRRFKHD